MPSCYAAQRHSAVIAIAALTAVMSRPPIIRAATGIARSVRATRACAGSRRGKGSCCPRATCMPSSPYRANWPLSHCRTKRSSSTCCFVPAPRRCSRSPEPRHLGAEIGFFSVLHTWDQRLLFHPHIHCVLPAGGLSPDHTLDQFFATVLSAHQGAQSCLSRQVRRRTEGRLPCRISHFHHTPSTSRIRISSQPGCEPLPSRLGRVRQAPFRWSRTRLALSRRIHPSRGHLQPQTDCTPRWQRHFRWRDSAHGNKRNLMTLTADEFLRRFLLHLLPRGFCAFATSAFLPTVGVPPAAPLLRTAAWLCRSRLTGNTRTSLEFMALSDACGGTMLVIDSLSTPIFFFALHHRSRSVQHDSTSRTAPPSRCTQPGNRRSLRPITESVVKLLTLLVTVLSPQPQHRPPPHSIHLIKRRLSIPRPIHLKCSRPHSNHISLRRPGGFLQVAVSKAPLTSHRDTSH